MMLVYPNPAFFINFFHMGAIFCFFSAILMSSTYTDKNSPCFRWTNRHSQFCSFSHPSFNRTPSNCLSHKSPASGCRYKFLSWGTAGSSMFIHVLSHLCRGRRIHISGHSDFGILSNQVYPPFLPECTAIPRQLLAHHCLVAWQWHPLLFAAVIWDADEPCSVQTAYAPESSSVLTPHFWDDICPST